MIGSLLLIAGLFMGLLSGGIVFQRPVDVPDTRVLAVISAYENVLQDYPQTRLGTITVHSIEPFDEDAIDTTIETAVGMKHELGGDVVPAPSELSSIREHLVGYVADQAYVVHASYATSGRRTPTVLLVSLSREVVFYDAYLWGVIVTAKAAPAVLTRGSDSQTPTVLTPTETWNYDTAMDGYNAGGTLIARLHWSVTTVTTVSNYIAPLVPGHADFAITMTTWCEEFVWPACAENSAEWYVGDATIPWVGIPDGGFLCLGNGPWDTTRMTMTGANDDHFIDDRVNQLGSDDGQGKSWRMTFSTGVSTSPSGSFGIGIAPPPADSFVGIETDRTNNRLLRLMTRVTCSMTELPPYHGIYKGSGSISMSAKIEAGTNVVTQIGRIQVDYWLQAVVHTHLLGTGVWPAPPHIFWTWATAIHTAFLSYIRGAAIPLLQATATATDTSLLIGETSDIVVTLTNGADPDGISLTDIQTSLDPASLGHSLVIEGQQVRSVPGSLPPPPPPDNSLTLTYVVKAWQVGTTTPQLSIRYREGAPVPRGLENRFLYLNLPTIQVTDTTLPPNANAGPDINIGEGDTASLDGGFSTDSDGTILRYEWDFNGGGYDSTNPYAQQPWFDDGSYSVTLRVTDDDGLTDTDVVLVNVANRAPTAILGAPIFVSPMTISISADAEDLGTDDLTFLWAWGDSMTTSTTYYNNGVSPDPDPSNNGVHPFRARDAKQHTYTTPGSYMITLTVTDDDSGSVQATTFSSPYRVSTAISDPSDTIVYSDSAKFHATLRDMDGRPLKGQASAPKTAYLEWRAGPSWTVLDTDTLSSPLDDDYELEFDVSIPASFDPIAGTFSNDIRVRFDGDSAYQATSTLGTLTTYHEDVVLSPPGMVYVVATDLVSVPVVVTDGDPVPQPLDHQGDEPKTLVLEYTLIGGEQTWNTLDTEILVGSSVSFTFSLPQPPFETPGGAYSMRARFDGDYRYSPSVSPGVVVVQTEQVDIDLPIGTPTAAVVYSDEGTMDVTILDDDGSPLVLQVEEPKTFHLEASRDVGVTWDVVDSRVLAGTVITFHIRVPQNWDPGYAIAAALNFPIRVRFDGDSVYMGAISVTGSLLVLPDATQVFSDQPSYELLGDILAIGGTLLDDDFSVLLNQGDNPATVDLELLSAVLGTWRSVDSAILGGP